MRSKMERMLGTYFLFMLFPLVLGSSLYPTITVKHHNQKIDGYLENVSKLAAVMNMT